jgi:hypothetical protein
MTQPELYRAYAEACFRIAKAAADEAERARWISMAQHWLDWAQEEETKLAQNIGGPEQRK